VIDKEKREKGRGGEKRDEYGIVDAL